MADHLSNRYLILSHLSLNHALSHHHGLFISHCHHDLRDRFQVRLQVPTFFLELLLFLGYEPDAPIVHVSFVILHVIYLFIVFILPVYL